MNVQELDRVLNWIKTHPELHNQAHWVRTQQVRETGVCNTTMCMAGTTAALNGYDFEPVTQIQLGQLFVSEATRCHPHDEPDKHEQIRIVAMRILGFTAEEADWFFLHCQSLEELIEGRDAVVDGGMTPVYVNDREPHNMILMSVDDLARDHRSGDVFDPILRCSGLMRENAGQGADCGSTVPHLPHAR